jgi:hypothetical protein
MKMTVLASIEPAMKENEMLMTWAQYAADIWDTKHARGILMGNLKEETS